MRDEIGIIIVVTGAVLQRWPCIAQGNRSGRNTVVVQMISTYGVLPPSEYLSSQPFMLYDSLAYLPILQSVFIRIAFASLDIFGWLFC